MTKHEFDAQTRENWGERMASDERRSYRETRRLPPLFFGRTTDYRDVLARRRDRVPGGLPTLAMGSQFRTVALYRLAHGLPLLNGF